MNRAMNLATTFQSFKSIYGICPCCDEVFRLSDATLFTRGRPPKTPFDHIDEQSERLERQVERFGEDEEEIREHARRKGARVAQEHLERIAPFFVKRRINPRDVKVIFSPVSYVVFQGLSEGLPRGIVLVDRPASNVQHERVQRSIGRAIRAGSLEWHTLRIETDGRVALEH